MGTNKEFLQWVSMLDPIIVADIDCTAGNTSANLAWICLHTLFMAFPLFRIAAPRCRCVVNSCHYGILPPLPVKSKGIGRNRRDPEEHWSLQKKRRHPRDPWPKSGDSRLKICKSQRMITVLWSKNMAIVWLCNTTSSGQHRQLYRIWGSNSPNKDGTSR